MNYPLHTPAQLTSFIEGLRKKVGYTQEEAGTLLGISQQAYQKIERNPERASFERIMQILKLFNAGFVVLDNIDPGFEKSQLPLHVSRSEIDAMPAQQKAAQSEDAVKPNTAQKPGAGDMVTGSNDEHNRIADNAVILVKATGKKASW